MISKFNGPVKKNNQQPCFIKFKIQSCSMTKWKFAQFPSINIFLNSLILTQKHYSIINLI